MDTLEEKLDILFLEIMNEEITPIRLKEMLGGMDVSSYSDIENVIKPFISRLEEMGIDGLKIGNLPLFLYVGEILSVFKKMYFKSLNKKRNYTTTQIEFNKNGFCSDCTNFFQIPENIGTEKLNEIRCINCNSLNWQNSNELKNLLAFTN